MGKMEYGVVALLDILGARGLWHQNNIEKIIQSWVEIQEHLKKEVKIQKDMIREIRSKFKPQVHAFSDTIIVTFQTNEYNPHDIINMCFTVGSTFSFAVERGLLFRGAIAIGKFYSHQNMILGPAIDDAAEWYSIPDWGGIHLTPSTTFSIEGFLLNDIERKICLCPYNIPIKNKDGSKSKLKGWAVNWPAIYMSESHMYVTDLTKNFNLNELTNEKFKHYFMRKFSKKSISEKEITKYQNTIEFIEYALDYYDKNVINI